MKNKLPETSLAAYKALTPEKLNTDYGKILSALSDLSEATYEELSDKIGFTDRNSVSRRLSEMEAAQMIYKPGNKRFTKRNRQAFTYKLVTMNGETSAEPEKLMEGKSVGYYAKDLIQKSLFD